MDWLAGPAQQVGVPSLIGEFDEFAWRMLAAGFPLLRSTLHLRTLHPQYLGANFVWWRTTGRTVSHYVTHEVQDSDLYVHEDNPVRRVLVGGQTIRRRLLSIFPIESSGLISAAAQNALAAAVQAVEAAKSLSSYGEPELEIIVALHVGTAFYGNIGAADRLDFTVIGSAVNLVSRIEAVGKALKIPIIVSDDFACSYSRPLHPLGRHVLRGLATPHELYAPALPPSARRSLAKAE